MSGDTIDMTPSWLAAVRIAAMVLQNEAAPMESHRIALDTIEDAARLADLYAAHKRIGTIR